LVNRLKGHPDLAEAQRAADRITKALEPFNEELSETLENALNAETPEARAQSHREAAALIGDYLADLEGDPVISMLDHSPLVAVGVHKTLATTLKTLASKLS